MTTLAREPSPGPSVSPSVSPLAEPSAKLPAGSLASRQAALVAALVGGGDPPADFDPVRVRATIAALLRKRAGEVGDRWPTLRAQFGPQWTTAFADWARGRPPKGSLRDGWDFARDLARDGRLTSVAAEDLAMLDVRQVYDGGAPPRRRRLPGVRWQHGTLIVGFAGRAIRLRRR